MPFIPLRFIPQRFRGGDLRYNWRMTDNAQPIHDSAPDPLRPDPLRRFRPAVLALVGVAQGWTIHFADLWGENYRLPPEYAAFLGFVCVGGFAAQLLLRENVRPRQLGFAALWGALWAAPFAWVFHRGLEFDFVNRHPSLMISAAAGVFLAAPFLAGAPRYDRIFARMCDNLLAAGAGICIAAVVSLVVRLGSELFAILGISVLKEWTTTDFFFWSVYPAVFGAGMALPVWRFRNPALALFKFPALVGAVFALAFAMALAAVGPAPLWERNIAAPMLLALTAVMLLFTNAAWRDGRVPSEPSGTESESESEKTEGGFGKWFRNILSLSLTALPLFAGLATWGIWLRIQQYGLTPPRIWIGYAGMFLLLAALAYAACAVASLGGGGGIGGRRKWLSGLRRANPVLVWLWIGIAYLAHTPALDPVRLSAESQLARASAGGATAETADLGALYNLGGYGLRSLSDLESRLQNTDEARSDFLLAEMESLQKAQAEGRLELALLTRDWREVKVYGDATRTATEIVAAMREAHPFWNLGCRPPGECALLATDLNRDAEPEHCLIRIYPRRGHLDCFVLEDGKFRRLGGLIPREGDWHGDALAGVPDDLASGNWRAVPAELNDVVIGDRVFFLSPNRRDGW